MLTTPQALCSAALEEIGVLGAGAAAGGTEVTSAYNRLQLMIDNWRTDNLFVLTREVIDHTLDVGEDAYTIGDGGDIDEPRPSDIYQASYVMQASTDNALEQELDILTIEEWQRIPVKGIESTLPQALWYEQTYPLGTIHLWPIYIGSDTLLRLYLDREMEAFTGQTQSLNLAPGYAEAIMLNLAVALQPRYGRARGESAALIRELAKTSLGNVRRINIKPVLVTTDPAVVRRPTGDSSKFNIYTGQ